MNLICTQTLLPHQGSVTVLAVSQAGSALELWTALRGFGLGDRIQARSWLLLGLPQAYPSQASHMGSFGVSACPLGTGGQCPPHAAPNELPSAWLCHHCCQDSVQPLSPHSRYNACLAPPLMDFGAFLLTFSTVCKLYVYLIISSSK